LEKGTPKKHTPKNPYVKTSKYGSAYYGSQLMKLKSFQLPASQPEQIDGRPKDPGQNLGPRPRSNPPKPKRTPNRSDQPSDREGVPSDLDQGEIIAGFFVLGWGRGGLWLKNIPKAVVGKMHHHHVI